jgi:hypothetical protein
MAITIVSTTGNISDPGTSVAVTVPSFVANDVIIALCADNGDHAATPAVPTSTNLTFTRRVVANSSQGQNDGETAIYTAVAAGSASSEVVTWNPATAGDNPTLVIVVLRNANTTALTNTARFGANPITSNNAHTTITIAGTTTSYVFGVAQTVSNPINATANAGTTPTTELYDVVDNSFGAGRCAFRSTNQLTNGTVADIGETWASGPTDGNLCLIEIAEAAGGPTFVPEDDSWNAPTQFPDAGIISIW